MRKFQSQRKFSENKNLEEYLELSKNFKKLLNNLNKPEHHQY